MAWHHVPTEDLPASVALFLGLGGIVAMSLAVLLWWGPDSQGGGASAKTPEAPKGHVPQLVVGAEYGDEAARSAQSEDMSGLLQWLNDHPDYSVVVVPRR